MIRDIPEKRVEMLKVLAKNYDVYLFSNTNAIHIKRLHKEFREMYGIEFPSLFVKDFYSHEIHERKPDLNSYLKVIELSGIIPAKTLFVDDLEKNILGAEKAGLKTFWLKEGTEVSEVFISKS
jgi:glucose-1-phosphatase